jgi:hypothetical protein
LARAFFNRGFARSGNRQYSRRSRITMRPYV